jgi:hypothetical protein
MFIQTKAPSPPGTVLDFAFGLGDGFEIIRGKGEVVWNRAEDDGPERPAGMGIRFLDLSEGSKELIYRMVDQYVAEGGKPFDLKEGAGGSPEGDLLFPQAAAPPPPPAADSGPSLFPEVPELGATPELEWEAEPAWTAEAPAEPAPWPGPLEDGSSSPAGFLPEVPPAPEIAPRRAVGGAAVVRSPRAWRSPLFFAAALVLIAGGGAAAFLFRDTLLPMIAGGGEQVSRGDVEGMLPPPPAAPVAGAGAPPAGEPSRLAAPPPAEPARAPSTGPPLSRVERITWEESFGGTDVILWGNGAIREEVYKRFRLGGNPPRELIRISGIDRPFPLARLVVGTGDVLQVRTGFHPSPEGNELHIVLDLAHPNVQVTRVEEGEGRLKVHLQRSPASPSGP